MSHKYLYKRVTETGVRDYERAAGSVAEVMRAVREECGDDCRVVYAGFVEGIDGSGVAHAYYYWREY